MTIYTWSLNNEIFQYKTYRILIKNRPNFLFFFYNNIFDLNYFFSSVLFPNSYFKVSDYIYFDKVCDILFSSMYNNIFLVFYSKFILKLNFNLFHSSNFFINKFYKYNFWKFNYNSLYNVNSINKRALRNLESRRSSYLIGFKMQCSGRFSRKQRASSLWFSENKIPLNTLNAIIDYNFFTIPLRNSAASVKVWLYRTKNFNKYYFRLF